MFFLVDDHGEQLGKYRSREEALEAWERLVEEDALAYEECAIIELDSKGKRVSVISDAAGRGLAPTTPRSG